MAHRLAAGPRPHPPAEAHPGVPDTARTARHAVQARAGATRAPAGHRGGSAYRVVAGTRGARIRELPRGHRRVGTPQGAVARREEARRARAVGARAAAAVPAGDRGTPEPAAAAHAAAAGATRLSTARNCASRARPANTTQQDAQFLGDPAGRIARKHLRRLRQAPRRLACPAPFVHHAVMGRIFEVRKHTMFARWNRMAKQFARIAKDITMAVKAGGPDPASNRSEERRVGKECRSRWSPY